MVESTQDELGTVGKTGGDRELVVVGIGASAGGLAAIRAFLEAVPDDQGWAIVVVTHHRRDQESLLAEVLRGHTTLPVVDASHDADLEADHVYVCPPAAVVRLTDGRLCLSPPPDERPPLPVDALFRSMAEELGPDGVAVVMSGGGSDGTVGATAVKSALGLVVAQDPETAEHRGMPSSVIEAGVVDLVLPPEQMPRGIAAFLQAAHGRPGPPDPGPAVAPDEVRAICDVVLQQTGRDFHQYKRSTITRRIQRRMRICHDATAAEYLAHLEAHPTEVTVLAREMLVGVTHFFRDPGAFESLREQMLARMQDKEAQATTRAWVAGCSTGEEAYSIAILLHECAAELRRPPKIQVFATDLDADAVEIARAGRYPDGIAADVSPERLQRWFVREEGNFVVSKDLRESVIFAPHDLTSDPPFSRLDLLACRNVLIYLEPGVQRRLLPTFHYALAPGGVLMLGSSESLGRSSGSFHPIDRKWRLYRRDDTLARGRLVLVSPPDHRSAPTPGQLPSGHRASAYTTALLEQLPPAVITDPHGRIEYFHGRTGRFLEPAEGEPQTDLYTMARSPLASVLPALIHEAVAEGEASREAVEVDLDGGPIYVDLVARRLERPQAVRDRVIVVFREVPATPEHADAEEPHGREQRLEGEIRSLKADLQRTIEELQSSNEELQSANEEYQSTNEELQSANEELETSREEMQSLNEELTTLNHDLQLKVEEVSRANDDMANLLKGASVAAVFLDSDLRIKSFTTEAARIIRLIPSDVGREIGAFAVALEYDDLVHDAREVLATLIPRERELVTPDGESWYRMRMLPYRTSANVIEGLVVSFADITPYRMALTQLDEVVEAGEQPMVSIDAQGTVILANAAFHGAFGVDANATAGASVFELLGESNATPLRKLIEQVATLGTRAQAAIAIASGDEAASPGGERRETKVWGRPLLGTASKPDRILLMFGHPR